MNLRLILPLLALTLSSAFASEINYGSGSLYRTDGIVRSVYVRGPDLFFVTVKDPGDGAIVSAWMKGTNNYTLATILAAKSTGTTLKIYYAKMTGGNDRNNNCWDVPYQYWVCNRLDYVEGAE